MCNKELTAIQIALRNLNPLAEALIISPMGEIFSDGDMDIFVLEKNFDIKDAILAI